MPPRYRPGRPGPHIIVVVRDDAASRSADAVQNIAVAQVGDSGDCVPASVGVVVGDRSAESSQVRTDQRGSVTCRVRSTAGRSKGLDAKRSGKPHQNHVAYFPVVDRMLHDDRHC